MRIATYNILKGGAKRVHWSKLIEEHLVDLLLVQESFAHAEYLSPLLYPYASRQAVWEMIDPIGWGSAIFSRTGQVTPVAVSGFAGWAVGAEIRDAQWQEGICDSLLVFSVHVPKRKQTYAKEANKLLDEICRISVGREIIIGGDFNLTISSGADLERTIGEQDLAIQTRLAQDFGLLNCWQAANPNLPLQQTLRWAGNRTIPYHCDGLFVPQEWKKWLQSCAVLSGDEWNLLSDHNPVVACFAKNDAIGDAS